MSRKLNILKDHADEKLVFHKQQEVGGILEENKKEYLNPGKDMGFGRKVASVPIDVLEKWIEEGIDYRKIQKDPAMARKFRQKLESPEWRYFKTHPDNIRLVFRDVF